MTRSELKLFLVEAELRKLLCKVYFSHDGFDEYLIPLKSSERLFLSAFEDEFMLDGYSISRIKDVEDFVLAPPAFQTILYEEGIINSIETPDIDITDWYSSFKWLEDQGRYVIAERKTYDEDGFFVIGKVMRVGKTGVYIWHFDANGIWDEYPTRVMYSEITNVTFSNRYVEVFAKYIGAPPSDEGFEYKDDIAERGRVLEFRPDHSK